MSATNTKFDDDLLGLFILLTLLDSREMLWVSMVNVVPNDDLKEWCS